MLLLVAVVPVRAQESAPEKPNPLAPLARLIGGQWHLENTYVTYEWSVGKLAGRHVCMMGTQLSHLCASAALAQDAVWALNEVTKCLALAKDPEPFYRCVAAIKLAQTNLRNLVGDLALDESLTSRELINTKLREILDDATDKWGTKVTRVELQRIEPPADVTEAMHRQMKAEREKRANILESEGQRQS